VNFSGFDRIFEVNIHRDGNPGSGQRCGGSKPYAAVLKLFANRCRAQRSTVEHDPVIERGVADVFPDFEYRVGG
jgi:hypothetical protein